VIDFRYHLVSIVAVFLALAIGIVLGSTELQGPAFSLLDKTTSKLQSELGQVSSQRDTAQQQATEGEMYAQAVEPALLHNLLTGHRLLIVTEPGAQSSVVSGITAAAIHAGATVTGQINLQPKFFDTSGTAQDSLNQTTLAVAQPTGLQLDASATYQQQAAQLIASEILTSAPGSAAGGTGGDQATSTEASTMLQAYAASQFLSTSGQPGTPASLAVVVTPQTAPSDGSADQLAQVLVGLEPHQPLRVRAQRIGAIRRERSRFEHAQAADAEPFGARGDLLGRGIEIFPRRSRAGVEQHRGDRKIELRARLRGRRTP